MVYTICYRESDTCPSELPLKIPYPRVMIQLTSLRHLLCIMSQYEAGRIDSAIMGLAELRMRIGMGVSRRLCHGVRCDIAGHGGILLTIPGVDLRLGVRMTEHVVGWCTGCERPVVHDVRGGGR